MFKLDKEGTYPTLYYNKKPLHSTINPIKEARHFAEKTYESNKDCSHYILFGLGLGYPLFELSQLLREKKKTFYLLGIFFTEDELQFFIELNHSTLKSFPEIRLSYYNDIKTMNEYLFRVLRSPLDIDSIALVEYTPIVNQFQEKKKESLEIIKQLLYFRTQSIATQVEMMPLWTKNIIENITQALKKSYEISFQGDVILIAAGPSLNQNLDFLRDHQSKAPLIALDTAYPTLIEAGIMPDIVISCDAQIYNYYDFTHMLYSIPFDKRPGLIADITQCKAISREFEVIAFARSDEVAEAISEYFTPQGNFFTFNEPLLSGGSVASFGLGALYKAGASRVILVGQDLSYHYTTHSTSSISSYKAIFSTNRLNPFWNYYKTVIVEEKGSQMLTNLKDWIENFFDIFPIKGIQRDPKKVLKNLTIYPEECEIVGEFKFSQKQNNDEMKKELLYKIKELLSMLEKIKRMNQVNEIELWKNSLSSEIKELMNALFLREELYRKRAKTYHENTYLRMLFLSIEKISRQLENALILINE